MGWTLEVHGQHFDIADARHLESELRGLQVVFRSEPEIIHLYAPDESSLSIWLGYDLVPLTWSAPEGWPSKHLFGIVDDSKILSFMMAGHHSEIPEALAVPFERAIAVAIEFFETQKLSESVEWEDD